MVLAYPALDALRGQNASIPCSNSSMLCSNLSNLWHKDPPKEEFVFLRESVVLDFTGVAVSRF